MYAVEFETYSKNGIIKIPSEYNDLANTKLKVIVLKEHQFSLPNKEKIKMMFDKIKEKNVFHKIDDPIKWQKELRSEWE